MNSIQVTDGGYLGEGIYWMQDTYGNYVEGSLETIARSSVGIAKADTAYGANAAVALFAKKVDSGYANLEVGQSLQDENGVEFGYAISDTKVALS
jgi:hypothetical protein